MDKNNYFQDMNKIKTRILIVLIILIAFLINVNLLMFQNMKDHIDYRIPDNNLLNRIQYIILILGFIVYITYIYKFIKFFKSIRDYEKNIKENKDEDFIIIYKKYSDVKITEPLFYITAIGVYTYLLILTLQML